MPYGEPQQNVPVLEMVDEELLGETSLGMPLPPVELVPVTDAVAVIRAAAEVVVGLALIVNIHWRRGTVDVDAPQLLRG